MKEKVMITVFWHNRRHAWFQCLIGIKLWLLDDLNHSVFHNWYIITILLANAWRAIQEKCPNGAETCSLFASSRKFTLNQFLALCDVAPFQIIFLLSFLWSLIIGFVTCKFCVCVHWTHSEINRRMTIINNNECNVAIEEREQQAYWNL